MRTTTTDGKIIETVEHCTCGLTAGCENCQPIVYEISGYPWPAIAPDEDDEPDA